MTDHSSPQPDRYSFGEFSLDTRDRKLWRGTEPVALGGKAFDVLFVLVQRAGAVVAKEELLAVVWPDAHVSEDNLKQTISVLRRALGEDPEHPRFIGTVPRHGYRFLASLDTPPGPDVEAMRNVARVSRPTVFALGTAALIAVVALSAASFMPIAGSVSPAATTISAIRFDQTAPAGTTLASGGTLSPDGQHLAFIARDSADGSTALWVRSLNAARSQRLAGTAGAFRPFWSPDSRYIAFFADGRLKKIGLGGPAPQVLATVGYRPSGGAWSSSGVLVYADRSSQLFGVSENGDGAVVAITTLDRTRQETAHRALQFFPDGRTFLVEVNSADPAHDGTFVTSLDDPAARRRLLDGTASQVTFVPPASVVYLRQQTLFAQTIDPASLRLTGAAAPIGGLSTASRSFTAGGRLLAFGGQTVAQRLSWFDRDGRALGPVATQRTLHNPALDPADRQLVASGNGVWVIDLERGAPTRIGDGMLPEWSADGTAVVFTRVGASTADVILKALDGADEEHLLVGGREMKLPGNWSDDGRYFAYVASSPDTRLDLWVLDTDDAEQARPFLQTRSNEMQPQISPDGRWIAYASDETGMWQVYVQSFPSGGAKRSVSIDGGAEPQWTKAGRELVYLRPDGTLMAAAMTAEDDTMQPDSPRVLFRVSLAGDITTFRNNYAVTADGMRFIVDAADESTREPISVVVNWEQLLR